MQISELIEAGLATMAWNEQPSGWRMVDVGDFSIWASPDFMGEIS